MYNFYAFNQNGDIVFIGKFTDEEEANRDVSTFGYLWVFSELELDELLATIDEARERARNA